MFKLNPVFSSTINTINLTYVSNGDSNDVFNYIGTLNNTAAWTNPQSILNPITVTVNTLNTGTAASITDRTATGCATTDIANSNVVINLGIGRQLLLNRYSYRTRSLNTNYIRNWKFQGSTDGINWIDLDTQVNNATIVAGSGWVSPIVSGITISYQYFRLLQTGLNNSSTNILSPGELQLYGTYSYY